MNNSLCFKRFVVLLWLCIVVTACGGDNDGSGTTQPLNYPPAATATPTAEQSVTLRGSVTYDFIPALPSGGLDYNNIERRPVRGARVIGVNSDAQAIAEAVTDAQGRYELWVFQNQPVKVLVVAHLLREGQPSWDFRVTDNTQGNAQYLMEGSLANAGSVASERNLHAASGWDGASYSGPRTAAPFAILDSVYQSVERVLEEDASLSFPAAELRWSPNNLPISGSPSEGNISTSLYSVEDGNIYILGAEGDDTDEFDRSVIQHEWAHYFEAQFSRSDSVGGPHSAVAIIDMRVAHSEGFANAFSAIASGQPFYSDSRGAGQQLGFSFSLESNTFGNPGWFNENSIGKLFYDIADEANDGADNLALGFSSIYQTLISSDYRNSDALTSIYLFTDVLSRALSNTQREDLSAMLDSESIFGRGEYGEGETNDSFDNVSTALPVYAQLSLGGQINLCGNSREGEYNGLDVRRFIRVDIPAAANYRIEAVKTLGTGDRDPDILVWKTGNVVSVLESVAVDQESDILSLTVGTYILELYDYLNVDQLPGGGSSCFDVSINQV